MSLGLAAFVVARTDSVGVRGSCVVPVVHLKMLPVELHLSSRKIEGVIFSICHFDLLRFYFLKNPAVPQHPFTRVSVVLYKIIAINRKNAVSGPFSAARRHKCAPSHRGMCPKSAISTPPVDPLYWGPRWLMWILWPYVQGKQGDLLGGRNSYFGAHTGWQGPVGADARRVV